MDLKSVVTGVMVSIGGYFGCSKATPPTTATAAAVQSSVKDLGVLQMTNNYETCVSIGGGNDCRMVPRILGRKDIQITVTFESKKPDGTTTGLSVLQLQGTPAKPFEVSVGSADFTFTAQVADE